MAGLNVKIEMPNDAELKRMFDAVPALERHKVTDKALNASGKVVLDRARQLAPRGNQVDREKRSDSQKQRANWNTPLWKTIAKKYVKNNRGGGVILVGPKWPDGNKAYFNTSPKGRRVFYWGKDAGITKPQIRNWIVQAFDETKTQQLAAMKASITASMDAIFKGK